jgi:hypothetical protein
VEGGGGSSREREGSAWEVRGEVPSDVGLFIGERPGAAHAELVLACQWRFGQLGLRDSRRGVDATRRRCCWTRPGGQRCNGQRVGVATSARWPAACDSDALVAGDGVLARGTRDGAGDEATAWSGTVAWRASSLVG